MAVTTKNEDGTMDFLSQGMDLPHPHKILIAMGRAGVESRFLGFSFSSLFTYGHLGSASAPGQIPAGSLSKSIKEIYCAE